MSRRSLFLCLSLSPIAFAVCAVGLGLAFDTLLGTLVGDVAIIVPLVLLVIRPDESKRWLIIALATFGLLVPAVAMYFSPAFANRLGGSPAQITLDPPPHAMPAEGAAFVRGLSVKDGVMLLRWRPGESENPRTPYAACDYKDWNYPPSHFADERGNGLEFTLIAADTLRLRDDRGGYADVRWTGSQFQLIAGRSAGQADSARSPGRAAVVLRTAGNWLLLLTPLLAWLALTRWAQAQPSGRNSAALIVAGVLQAIGAAGLSLAILGSNQHLDEVSGGLLMLLIVASTAASLAGLAILGWKLLGLLSDAPDPLNG